MRSPQPDKILCDMCNTQVTENQIQSVKYPVMFTTEQTEGRSINPKISYENIDMCESCLNKSIKIVGSGAQGFNNYRWKETEYIEIKE